MEINIRFDEFLEDPLIIPLLIEHLKTLTKENGKFITIRIPDLPKEYYANSDNIIFDSSMDWDKDYGGECPMFWYNKVFFDTFGLNY